MLFDRLENLALHIWTGGMDGCELADWVQCDMHVDLDVLDQSERMFRDEIDKTYSGSDRPKGWDR
jgi:hypothetical protein